MQELAERLGIGLQSNQLFNSNLSKMNLDKITNPIVKEYIEALQARDNATWLTLFTDDAKLTDIGQA